MEFYLKRHRGFRNHLQAFADPEHQRLVYEARIEGFFKPVLHLKDRNKQLLFRMEKRRGFYLPKNEEVQVYPGNAPNSAFSIRPEEFRRGWWTGTADHRRFDFFLHRKFGASLFANDQQVARMESNGNMWSRRRHFKLEANDEEPDGLMLAFPFALWYVGGLQRHDEPYLTVSLLNKEARGRDLSWRATKR